MSGSLVTVFLEAVSPTVRRMLTSSAGVEPLVMAALATATQAHPSLHVPPEAFVRHLASQLRDDDGADALAALNVGDLYLACGCALGLSEALREFQAVHVPALHRVLVRQGATEAMAEEVVSSLCTKLLIRGTGEPRIATYAGRGSLAQWLRASAVRALIDLRRVDRPESTVSDELLGELPDGGASPELTALKGEHQAAFNEAFREALAALSDRDRTLLRLHTIERSTIDDIGALYQVHRVTAFRWVEAARQRLIEGTRERLKLTWRADSEELQSVLRGMASVVDLSLKTALG